MSMQHRAIFFDFDGVILESIAVKTEAFGKLFEPYGSAVQREVVAYHLAHGGVSRYDKFRYYYQHLLQEPLTPAKMAQLCQYFERLVYDGVLAAPFVVGALEFLECFVDQVDFYIVSGTPHEEINKIVDARELRKFFRSVHGSPTSKGTWVAQLLEKSGLKPEETVFIGDALSDYKGAVQNGVPFIGRVPEGEPNPFEECACAAIVPDLQALNSVLMELEQGAVRKKA